MRKLSGILLIDDDETNNFLNERILKKLDIAENIRVFQHGKQALDYLYIVAEGQHESNAGYFRPELIFLDINMPVMDGFEFMEQFQKIDPEFRDGIKVVILTTSAHERDTEMVKKFQIAEYLNKPLTMTKIMEIIEKHFVTPEPGTGA